MTVLSQFCLHYILGCPTSVVGRPNAFVRHCRPNFGILHVTGRMDPLQLKQRPTKGHRHVLHQDPTLMVSTSSSNESTDCQQIVDVNDDGVFQTDVAVNNDVSTWVVVVTACGSQHGTKANPCRTVVVAPPGERDGDGCHPVASRVAPTGEDRPDKSHYAVSVDFRRCFERRQSDSHQLHVVKVKRTRRQAVRPTITDSLTLCVAYTGAQKFRAIGVV